MGINKEGNLRWIGLVSCPMWVPLLVASCWGNRDKLRPVEPAEWLGRMHIRLIQPNTKSFFSCSWSNYVGQFYSKLLTTNAVVNQISVPPPLVRQSTRVGHFEKTSGVRFRNFSTDYWTSFRQDLTFHQLPRMWSSPSFYHVLNREVSGQSHVDFMKACCRQFLGLFSLFDGTCRMFSVVGCCR